VNFFEELRKDIANTEPKADEQESKYGTETAIDASDKVHIQDDSPETEDIYYYDEKDKHYKKFDKNFDDADENNNNLEAKDNGGLSNQKIAEDRDNRLIRRITFYLCYFLACFALAFIIWSHCLEKKSYKNIDNLRLVVENEKAKIKLEKINNGETVVYSSNVGKLFSDEEIAAILSNDSKADDEILENIDLDSAQSQSEYYELLSIKNAPKELYPTLRDRKSFYVDRLSEYNKLYESNDEFAGWLEVPGTAISYPVMKHKDNDFYLTHNFEKKSDKFGMLTMDFRCPLNDTGSQYIIYGHNVRDGRLFGELLNYKNESFYSYEPVIMFDTPYVRGMYEVFAVVIIQVSPGSKPEYEYINWTDQESFENYVSQMKSMSLYKCRFMPKYGQPLLALVTCEKSTDTGRLVVLAAKNDMKE